MPWVTVIWSMIASACLTLGAIDGLAWSRKRSAWASRLVQQLQVSQAELRESEARLARAEHETQILRTEIAHGVACLDDGPARLGVGA